MGTEAASSASRGNRPRPILLVLLGVLVVVALWMKLGGSAGSGTPASNPGRRTQSQAQAQAAALAQQDTPRPGARKEVPVDAAMLDVKLEALKGERPAPADNERNPFRFRPKPPPPQPAPPAGRSKETEPPPPPPVVAPPPAPTPPITVKFIGFLERANGPKLAVFVDCTQGRRQSHASEGAVIDGRYRLVKIQLNSVIVEHLDGRGRTTLAQTGQECVK
jgi:hypothetical protein